MSALLGLLLGTGLLLVLWSVWVPRRDRSFAPTSARGGSVRALLDGAGCGRASATVLVAGCMASGLSVVVLVAGVSGSATVSLAFGCVAAGVPVAVLRGRRDRRSRTRGDLWPDVVDDLTSAVRAGLALPEALVQVGVHGPEPLRPAFVVFAERHRAGGRFADGLDRLKADLSDPVGDRVVEALRIAREVGGHDLGVVLTGLSAFLRDDIRTRGELRARQAWTVNGARVAVAAPWLVLGMLSLRPRAVAAYDTAAGAVVLAIGAVACVVAYRLMRAIGRLPAEVRVFA